MLYAFDSSRNCVVFAYPNICKRTFIYFRRKEFQREVTFRNFGSQRPEFNFEDMSDIVIPLPPISIQQKYVAVYNAMLANQQSYEHGLEELKLTCDAYIEELRRNTPSVAIGKYLMLSDERNTLNLSANSVRGLSVSKDMIETKANMDGVNISNYKIIPPRYIAYVSDTSRRDDKMSLGFNRTEETFLYPPSLQFLRRIHNTCCRNF